VIVKIMVEQKLLCNYEVLDYDPKLIAEAHERDGKIVLRGILQRADALNQNGRVYPKGILEREIRNYQKFITESRALGECDHPDTSVVNLQNVSHIIRECNMEGDVVKGSLELLDTPSGKILQSLVSAGVRLGISSRGVGSTKKQGDYQVVQDDFQLITFDIVSEPSTSGAFLMPEGKTLTSRELQETFNRSDRINRLLNDILSCKNV
jgi:Prohead core protein protease.